MSAPRRPRLTGPVLAPSPWRGVAIATAIALGCAGIVSADRAGVPRPFGAAAGASAALLGVLALPSFPTRRVALALLAFGGLAAARHAALPGVDLTVLAIWAVATLIALLLVDRAQAEVTPPLAGSAPLASRAVETARVGVALALAVFIAVVAFAPTIAAAVHHNTMSGSQPGLNDRAQSSSSLQRSNELDMTARPRLSNRVVFSVEANHPDFWRGETWDQWNGVGWTRSDTRAAPLLRVGTHFDVDPRDIAAQSGTTMRQTFHIEAPYSDVVFGAPSIVGVETNEPLVERPDGSVAVALFANGFGRGASYTVTSRRAHATEATLRAAASRPIPGQILEQYAQPPNTTERVRDLANQITETAPTAYDKVLSIERWLSANTKYSLNAPVSQPGQDAVDQFVFDTRRGWCEQVASTLVVMLRSVGVPARVATGFVTGQHDAFTGRYVVRERDAHAWAEVYFGGVGWQGFDPTASVPLAGEAAATKSWLDEARAALPILAVIALAVAGAAAAAGALGRRRATPRRTPAWSGTMLTRLERLGRRVNVPRPPSLTVREYGEALAVRLGEPAVADIGTVIDTDAYSAGGVPDAARTAAERELARVEEVARQHRSRRGRTRVVRSVDVTASP